MAPLADHFAILEIPINASDEQIKQAYRDLAQVWHPDRYQNNARLRVKAEERLKLINAAYQSLCAERKERGYYRPVTTTTSSTPPQATTPPPPPQTPPRESWMPKNPPNGKGHYRRQADYSPKAGTTKTRNSRGSRSLRRICIAAAIVLIGVAAVYAKHIIFPKSSSATRAETLTELRTRIALLTQDKDRKFDTLEQWYRRGVRPEEETGYRAMLQGAQNQERQLEALITAYNARKRTEAKPPTR